MNNNTGNNNTNELENMAISAISAASKTPFRTAFKITVGIGMAHALVFVGTVTSLMIVYKLLF